ncbi:bestrophin-like domain [Streptomyces sp. NPDC057540]|uniref:bestrophin-like domain n=1 Tax=Streptomyces sp. NPDC057540 TaxID=3346160 RepID=UPI0036B3152A
MSLWLLNHFSTFTLAVVSVGGTVVLAVAGSVLLRRRYPSLARGEHNDMVGVTLGMFGAIYGIILAFVIVTLWTQLDSTQTIVASEATDTALIARDAAAFPPAVRADLDTALSGYVHAVVEDQWPRMRAGQPSYGATEAHLRSAFEVLQAYDPKSPREEVFYREAVTHLNDVAAQRRARLNMAEQELPPLLQALAFGGALVLVPLTFLYGMRKLRIQLLFVASVAALIGFSLLLVFVLDRPFAGELSVSPAPYQEGALAQYWER